MNVNVLEARNQLSALLRHVEEFPSDVITISRRGVPVADLVWHQPDRGFGISLGMGEGRYRIPDEDAMHMMDDEIAALMGL